MTAVPDRSELVQVGHVHGAHGIQGWVQVMSRTEPMTNIFGYGPWFLDLPQGLTPVQLQGQRPQGKGLVAKLSLCTDRNAAERLAGAPILVPRSALPALAEDEYFWADLMGMQVVTEQGVLLGELQAMMETGANDVIVVRPCAGSIDAQERLLPWLMRRVVRFVDRERRVITVDWDPSY